MQYTHWSWPGVNSALHPSLPGHRDPHPTRCVLPIIHLARPTYHSQVSSDGKLWLKATSGLIKFLRTALHSSCLALLLFLISLFFWGEVHMYIVVCVLLQSPHFCPTFFPQEMSCTFDTMSAFKELTQCTELLEPHVLQLGEQERKQNGLEHSHDSVLQSTGF
jgi:hypothetical protein